MANFPAKTASAADRGKKAEAEVKKMLQKLEAANCAYHRFPDARAGSFAVAPADFMFMQNGIFRLLEVKEVQHTHLLPYANFAPDQVARMRMWQAAGAKSWVLVCFKKASPSWRLAPVDWFLARPKTNEKGKAVGSWDMTEFPRMTIAEAFTGIVR